jgi:general secretion pathway protein L
VEYLAIRLGASTEDRIDWLLWSDAEDEIIASGTLANADDLASLKDKASNPNIIAIAPSSLVGFKQITLPNKSSRKVLQAIPFMLEEEVAHDINDLFFAFGDKTDNLQNVAYCKLTQLETWQAMLEEAGLFCDKLVPDILCLPDHDSAISALQINDELIVRTNAFNGIQGESIWLSDILAKHAISESQTVHVYSELSELNKLSDSGISIEQHFDDLPMQLLLKGARQSKFNLFQGQFAVKRKTTGHWQKYKVAAALAALALIVNLVDTTISLNKIEKERTAVRAQIKQATERGFPQLGKVLNHRRMIAREMQKLEQGGGSVSMLNMLARLSPVFADSGVSPQSLRFDSKRTELRMQSVASNFESLERFKRNAEQLGFSVEQGAINNQGDRVSGAIVIKG